VLEQLSITDGLTKLHNHRYFQESLTREIKRVSRSGDPLAILLIDIDDFKGLNDRHGHAEGDALLVRIARVLNESVRESDILARYGGEEFVVLLPDTPVDEGQQILTRLQRSLSVGLFMHEEKQVFVTFSAGVTAFRLGEPIEAALERADQALYDAKRNGKNRTCVA